MQDLQKKSLSLSDLKQKAGIVLDAQATAKIKGGSDAATPPPTYNIIQDDLDII